jgi:hypothetical protein
MGEFAIITFLCRRLKRLIRRSFRLSLQYDVVVDSIITHYISLTDLSYSLLMEPAPQVDLGRGLTMSGVGHNAFTSHCRVHLAHSTCQRPALLW